MNFKRLKDASTAFLSKLTARLFSVERSTDLQTKKHFRKMAESRVYVSLNRMSTSEALMLIQSRSVSYCRRFYQSFVFSDVIATWWCYVLSCRKTHLSVLEQIFLARDGTEYWWDASKYLVDWREPRFCGRRFRFAVETEWLAFSLYFAFQVLQDYVLKKLGILKKNYMRCETWFEKLKMKIMYKNDNNFCYLLIL